MDYQKQAQDFLDKTKTKFETKFLRFGSMPWDKDGQHRNIFGCTFSNENGEMTIEFGSSVADSCKKISKLELDSKESIFWGVGYPKLDISYCYKIETDTATLRRIKSGEVDAASLIDQDALSVSWDKCSKEVAAHKKATGRTLLTKEEAIPGIMDKIREHIDKLQKTLEYAKDIQQDPPIEHPNAYDVLSGLDGHMSDTFEDWCADFGFDEDSRSAEKTYEACKEQYAGICRLWNEEQRELLSEIQ